MQLECWSTPCRGERHRVGKGGEQVRERRRERQGKTGGYGTGTGMEKGEAGANGEGSRVRGQKSVRWSRMFWSTGSLTRGKVPIRFGTYNICNGHNEGL